MKMKRNAFLGTVLTLSLAVMFAFANVVPTITESGAPTVTVNAITNTRIDEYEVMYSANSFVPRIWLKSEGGYIGQLIFKPDGSVLPPDSMVSGQVNLYYHLEDFQNCIDLLRNEKPMYLIWAGSGVGNENGIKTIAEPVGEGEGGEPAPPSSLFEDGFETGSFSAWTSTVVTSGETATTGTGSAHHGTYSARFSSNGNLGAEKAYCYKNIASSAELYTRGYFNVATSGISANDNRFFFIVFKAGSNPVAYAGWRMTGGIVKWCLIVRDGTGWPTAYSSASPLLGQWYGVELHWKKDAATGLGELYVNGVLACSLTGKDTTAYGNVDRLEFGLPEIVNCASTTVYGDCAKVATTYIEPES